ncbi:bifunctional DNA primase/polymerase [Agromyces italicus]|uniref:bifunctional DNA primase/polymerase n=1 Tax=Agromyces italicus TaxID=279572 RepID=UPI0003B47F27|nr:bifunctional DNA primase/polymerase [Agromyces italicus]
MHYNDSAPTSRRKQGHPATRVYDSSAALVAEFDDRIRQHDAELLVNWAIIPTIGGKPALGTTFDLATARPDERARLGAEFFHDGWGVRLDWSDLLVLDLDVGHPNGRDGINDACELFGGHSPMSNIFATTPRGGIHLYYRAEPRFDRTEIGLNALSIDLLAGKRVVPFCGPGRELRGWWRQESVGIVPDYMRRVLVDVLPPERAAVPRFSDIRTSAPLTRETARRRLEGLLVAVRGAEAGTRNSTLNWAAYRAAEIVAAGGDEHGIAEALVDAARDAGLPPSEAWATVRSGLREGAQR